MRINEMINSDEAGQTSCVDCGSSLGDAKTDPLRFAKVREQKSTAAGPGIRVDPSYFTDRPIILRQAFCPNCLVLLSTEIVPGDEPSFRKWHLA